MDVTVVCKRGVNPDKQGVALTSRQVLTSIFPGGRRGPHRQNHLVTLLKGPHKVLVNLKKPERKKIEGLNVKVPSWVQSVLRVGDCQVVRVERPRKIDSLDLVELARPHGYNRAQLDDLEISASRILNRIKFVSVGLKVDVTLKCGRSNTLVELEVVRLSPNKSFGKMHPKKTHVNFQKLDNEPDEEEDDDDDD